MIDKNSPLPIYYQLEALIKELIEKGELKPGDLIPSEREFSEQYSISRMTVRQAINNLVNDGYLSRQQGKGTFVARQKLEQPLSGLTSFTEDMKARGYTPSTKIIDFKTITSSKNIAQKLKLTEGTLVYELKRIRLADNIPMAYETVYLPKEITGDISVDIVKGSLYQYLENNLQLKIAHGSQVIEASLARKIESDLLEIAEGQPILLIERITYLENNQPLEVVKSVYRGDKYKFVIDMQRRPLNNN